MDNHPSVAGDINQQVRAELAHLYTPDEAFTWLASPQQLLGGRIPSRMIAIGDGAEVLRILKALNDGAFL